MKPIANVYVLSTLVLITVISAASFAEITPPQGPVQELQKVEQSVANVNKLNRELVRAIMQGQQEEAKTLLSRGADVNFRQFGSLSILHITAANGNNQGVTLLLDNGAVVDARDNAGRTPLHYAAGGSVFGKTRQEWSVEVVQILLNKGADINAKDENGLTPLRYAIQIRNRDLIEFLIRHGADLDSIDKHGYTPYGWVCERISLEETYKGDKPAAERILQYKDIAGLLITNKTNHYVSVDGDDMNPGTEELPLKSISAAVRNAKPGDIIHTRGGLYYPEETIHLNKSGEYGKPIRLQAYPNETPILDFSRTKGNCMLITGAYWHLKGLVMTRGYRGIHILGIEAHHNVLEQLSCYGHSYSGFTMRDGIAHNVILNCDSHDNFDPQWNGEYSDGFEVRFGDRQGNILIGNRAWNNSDDGYDFTGAGHGIRLEWCYACDNGKNIWGYPMFGGDGNGFKLNRSSIPHILIRCVAWGNCTRGYIDLTENSGTALYNCIAFRNTPNYILSSTYGGISNNNVGFESEGRDGLARVISRKYNSWDSESDLSLRGTDFLSLDDSRVSAPRSPDGSIPYSNFLKLAPGSAAIDAGTDVNMPYVGKAPDLGAFEYDPNRTSDDYVKMLHQAVRDHDINEINKLVAEGEGINDEDWLGYTPLHWAVYFGYPDLIELLVSKGADPDIQSATGRYALEIARAMAYPELRALLHRLGAKADAVSADEGSVLPVHSVK